MGIVDRRLAALRRLERLHEVRRRLGGDPDLEAVIAELEDELGETVSRRSAARFLGVSHTTLGRWVRDGRVPVVENREGRLEVPVPALLRLAASGREGDGASISPSRSGARGRVGAGAAGRSLAYHRAVADRLSRELVDDALYRVRKWRAQGRLDPTYSDAWEQILSGPIERVRDVLTQESDEAADLRQNSPFAGVVSEPERRALIGAPGR